MVDPIRIFAQESPVFFCVFLLGLESRIVGLDHLPGKPRDVTKAQGEGLTDLP